MPAESLASDWPIWCGERAADPDTIHLFRIALPTDGIIMAAEFTELSPEEVHRAERYLIEAPRRQFVRTRVTLRRLLAALLSLDPAAIRFEFTQYGKPGLVSDQNPHGLSFNVSHSGAWAVIAVGWRRRIGVDLEAHDRRIDWRGLAQRFYSPDEQRQLAALPEALRHAAFYRLWSGKEAYLKATGLGMSFPLERFSVRADPRETPAVLHVDGEPTAADLWTGLAFAPDALTSGTLLWDQGPATVRLWTWPAD